MLQEDYIMRVFQQFNELLSKWLYKKRFDNVELVVSFNDEVVKPFLPEGIDFFETMSFEEIKSYFTEKYANDNERLELMEILAESLYQKALITDLAETKKKSLSLSLEFFEWIHAKDKTYSFERERKMEEIKNLQKMIY